MTLTRWLGLVAVAWLLSSPAWADEISDTYNQSLEALKRKDYYLAIAGFNAVLQLDPTNAAAYHNRGSAYHGLGNYDKAIANYTTAVRLDPAQALTYTSRGIAYKLKGDYNHAVADYATAIRIDPHSTIAYNNLASIWASCPNSEVRNGKMAVEYATKACALANWRAGEFLETLASAYAEVGEFNTAAQWQKKALACSGRSPEELEGARVVLAMFEQRRPYRDDGASRFANAADPETVVVARH